MLVAASAMQLAMGWPLTDVLLHLALWGGAAGAFVLLMACKRATQSRGDGFIGKVVRAQLALSSFARERVLLGPLALIPFFAVPLLCLLLAAGGSLQYSLTATLLSSVLGYIAGAAYNLIHSRSRS
ncbi:MAG: hypothetical protein GXX79_10525 [Actinomycetales bacterium]|nr:hypothetical protein [Actinomycetales bacterium]